MACLEPLAQSTSQTRPDTDVAIMDGAVLVNILRPSRYKTFSEYASNVFVPYINRELQQAGRVDIVWDQYFDNTCSLKAYTRESRVSGPSGRRRVEPSTPVPKNWQQFLRVCTNKVESFKLLSNELMMVTIPAGQELVIPDGEGVHGNPARNTVNISPCNHEEADSRIMLHIADAADRGFSKILVRTVDTAVVVLAVAIVQELGMSEIWIAFGTGKYFRYVPAHEISASLGPRKSLALPVFHALTGCDTVSHFAHVGKKTAWTVWETHDDITAAFCEQRGAPDEISDDLYSALERFTILMYDRTRTTVSINETRKLLFTRKGRPMAALPPSQAALHQHIRRATLQGGMTGVLPPSHIVCYHHLVTGVGHIHINGSHSGPIFLKPVYRAQRCCIAGAGRDAQTANVPRRS